MLPDFGWSELLVIAIVLIVVVGPKDLPKMLRSFGKTTSNLRKMAGDFRRQLDDALKEAELGDVTQVAKDLKGLDPRSQIRESLSPLGKIGQDINKELKKAASEAEKSATPLPSTEDRSRQSRRGSLASCSPSCCPRSRTSPIVSRCCVAWLIPEAAIRLGRCRC